MKFFIFIFALTITTSAFAYKEGHFKDCFSAGNIIEYCEYTDMSGYNQKDSLIPDDYDGESIDTGQTCGPTSMASIFGTIESRPDKITAQSFFNNNIKGKLVYEEKIPEFYVKMRTSKRHPGTNPFDIYYKAFNPNYFSKTSYRYLQFLSSSVSTNGSSYYAKKVLDNDYLMTFLTGYYGESCITIMGNRTCSYLIPAGLHYSTIGAAQKYKAYWMTKYKFWRYMGGGPTKKTTRLSTESGGCLKSISIRYCSSFSVNPFDFGCKYTTQNVCTDRKILPFGKSKMQRADSFNIDNKTYKEFVHGSVGIRFAP